MTGYTESRRADGTKYLARNSAQAYDQAPNVTVSGELGLVALNTDSDLPSLSICRLSPLKVSENRQQ